MDNPDVKETRSPLYIGVVIDTTTGLFTVSSAKKQEDKIARIAFRDHARLKITHYAEFRHLTIDDVEACVVGHGDDADEGNCLYIQFEGDAFTKMDWKKSIIEILMDDHGYAPLSQIPSSGKRRPTIDASVYKELDAALSGQRWSGVRPLRLAKALSFDEANSILTLNNAKANSKQYVSEPEPEVKAPMFYTPHEAVAAITDIMKQTASSTLYMDLAILGEVQGNLLQMRGIGK